MSQHIPALDDPFEWENIDDDSPIIELLQPAAIVSTPTGDELVALADLEEPTRVFNQVELAALIADSCPHRHVTVPSFHVVKEP